MEKEESEKVELKLNIKKMNIMASGPIISWQIDWGGWLRGRKQWLYFLAPKSLQVVTAAMKFKNASSFKEKPWQT